MNANDADTLAALARLNPAPEESGSAAPPLTFSQSQRADLTLNQILATDPGSPGPRADPTPATPGRRSRRRVLVPLVVLVSAVAVVAPVLTTGGDMAYASWSPLPVSLSPADSTAAARACLAALDREAAPPVTPVLAERRGAWTYVLIRPAKDVQSSCIMPTDEINEPAAADHRRWFWSEDEEVVDPVRNVDEVRVDTAATATTKEGLFSYSEGAVGRDVVDITFTTPRDVTVKASVANGRYAVWWPAGSNNIRSPEISEAPNIDVTLTNGTTYRHPR